jgi:hypothetical protein
MPTVTGTIQEPNAVSTPRTRITFQLDETTVYSSAVIPRETFDTNTGSDGTFSITLIEGDYTVSCKGETFKITVGPEGGDIADLITDGASFPSSLAATFGFYRVSTLAELITIPTRAINKLCVVLGATAAGDGGGGTFWWDSTGTTADNVYVTRRPTDYSTGGVWRRATDGAYSISWFGARPNGTNCATAFNTAGTIISAAGGGICSIPPGTFTINGEVTMRDGVCFVGSGLANTIIDGTGATVTNALFYGTGSLSALPALSGAHSAGGVTLTFASAHGLSQGDWVIVENTTDGSFNSARSNYHDGEHCEVATVNSTTQVTLVQPLYSSYSGASISVFKVTPINVGFRDMSMRFAPAQGANISGIQIALGKDIALKDMDLRGCQYAHVFFDRNFYVRAENIHCFDDSASIGLNYGLAFGCSQHVKLINCSGATQRHVVTFGGGTADGSVPNRDVKIIGGEYNTCGTSWALDFHGNSEHYEIIGVNAPGGLALAGDNGTVIGGHFGNANANGTSIVFAELCGLNFTLQTPTVYASRNFNSGLISCYARSTLTRSSVLALNNVRINMGTFASSTYPTGTIGAIELGVVGIPGNDDIEVNIDGGTVTTNHATVGPLYALQYISATTGGVPSGIRRINVKGLISPKAGLLFSGDCERVNVEGCILPRAYRYGIRVSDKGATVAYSPQRWVFRNNNLSSSQRDGIIFEGDTTYSDVVMEDNLSIDCGQETAATYYSIRIVGARNASLTENSIGDMQTSATQAGTYSAADVTVLKDLRQNNLGSEINPSLTFSHTSIGSLIDDPPANIPTWNRTAQGYEWGAAGASDLLPYLFRRDRNGFVQWQFQNKVAAGNVNCGMGITVVGGAVGNSSSVTLKANSQDYTTPVERGKAGIATNSDADALMLEAGTSGQTIDIITNNGTGLAIAGQWDGSTGLGNTRLLLLDVDAGTLKRVSIGAADSGGVGYKVLRVPN